MEKICYELKEIKRSCGVCEDALIIVQMDAPTIQFSDTKMLFSSGNSNDKCHNINVIHAKQIINAQNKSKLCQKCSLSRGKGKNLERYDCTMDLKMSDPNEDDRRCLGNTLSELLENSVTVNIVTSDPDGSAICGAGDLYVGKTAVRPQHNLDTVHAT